MGWNLAYQSVTWFFSVDELTHLLELLHDSFLFEILLFVAQSTLVRPIQLCVVSHAQFVLCNVHLAREMSELVHEGYKLSLFKV